MQQVNLHKQRLIAIAIGALGLIFLFLPWQKDSAPGFQSASHMGYVILGGIISAVAFAGVIGTSILLGDKTKAFDKQGKLIAIIAFAVALLMTILVLVSSSGTEQQAVNMFQAVEVKKSGGIGLWLTLILEIAGLVFVTGILDQLMQQKFTTPGSTPTPPPPPPPAPKP